MLPLHFQVKTDRAPTGAVREVYLASFKQAAREAEAVGEAIYSAWLFAGTRYIRAFNFKGAFSFRAPDEVNSADFRMPWTTNHESVRPIAETLIRATGDTPVYEGGLENAREY